MTILLLFLWGFTILRDIYVPIYKISTAQIRRPFFILKHLEAIAHLAIWQRLWNSSFQSTCMSHFGRGLQNQSLSQSNFLAFERSLKYILQWGEAFQCFLQEREKRYGTVKTYIMPGLRALKIPTFPATVPTSLVRKELTQSNYTHKG